MKERMLKAKQFKVYLQKHKMFVKLQRDVENKGFEIVGNIRNELHTDQKTMNKICKIFNLKPIKENHGGQYEFKLIVYIENVEIFCLVEDVPLELKSLYLDNEYKEYKALCFDLGSKEAAFEALKEKKLNNAYTKKHNPFYWMKSHIDYERYVNRRKKVQDLQENILSKYLYYKNNWEEKDSNCKYDDYYYPLTLKQWYEANY